MTMHWTSDFWRFVRRTGLITTLLAGSLTVTDHTIILVKHLPHPEPVDWAPLFLFPLAWPTTFPRN